MNNENDSIIEENAGLVASIKARLDEIAAQENVGLGERNTIDEGAARPADTVATNDTTVSQGDNPRTAIGQISPLHYLFIVVDSRTDASDGMTLQELAQEFVNRGADVAYNLDGGGSSAMWLNGALINNPTNGHRAGERNISDIIYVGY